MRTISYDAGIGRFSWGGAVDALRQGHRLPRAEIKDLFLGPADETLLTRAARIEGLGFGVKAATIRDGNKAFGVPTVHSTMMLFEPEFARPTAVIDGRLVTEIKTAADSALGAMLLARKTSRTLLIVGSGTVARSLVAAYSELFPELERIVLWSRRLDAAEALIASLPAMRIPVTAVPSLRDAMAEADIISSATTSRSPVLPGEWVRPGTHVDLIGAFKADMREADDRLIASGSLFVDSRETTIGHIGELMMPIRDGVISEADVRGDLYDLVPMAASPRQGDDEITVFKNGGGAHLDLMIADYVNKLQG